MTNTPETPVAFFIECSYCDGIHIASLSTSPYGGTTAYGNLMYGVVCFHPQGNAAQYGPIRYGVTGQSERRIYASTAGA